MTRFGSHRMVVVVGLLLATIIILFYMLANIAWEKYQDYGDRVDQLEPRISRLQGVEQSYELLQTANERVQSQLIALTYPAVKDTAMTGASMQRNIREKMEQAGMAISGSQILPVKVDNGYDKISVDVTAAGTLDSLQDVLINLKELRPSVIVESINIKPVRVRRKGVTNQKVTVRFRLLSLRLQS